MRPASIAVDPTVWAAALAAAGDALPNEFAAIVGGAHREGRAVVAAIEPLAASSGPEHFAVDARTFANAEAALRARGLAWLGFLHSHPGGSAALSLRDRAELWRGCLQIVVAVAPARRARANAFWLERDTAVPLPIEGNELTIEAAR